MSKYESVNILDMITAIGENELREILSEFICSKNTFFRNLLPDAAFVRTMQDVHAAFDSRKE